MTLRLFLTASRKQRGPIEPHFSAQADALPITSADIAAPGPLLTRLTVRVDSVNKETYKSLHSDESYRLWVNGSGAYVQANSMLVVSGIVCV